MHVILAKLVPDPSWLPRAAALRHRHTFFQSSLKS